ncbi:signal recognition particle protein [Nakamurella endophytica]|uniref:Signal recognition particle protein n=1 Tax=Nakamurella endophytica TaxID=1748367 RepID=A0A917SP91_9ACTN|nr:signal recognition particle protein [Nakamurella endophytica]GGL90372.1 signal recognition particle protein [Nakamurella endophytica]
MFDTLSDRLAGVFANLRGKGRLSPADVDATAREIRIALLEADVALPVVRTFVAAIKQRATGADISQALNPAQQVIKIVNEELVAILGGETRRLTFAKTGPTVIMLAGLQGSGKTTLAGKLALWLRNSGHTPLLVACDLQRPNAVTQLEVVGQQAGAAVFAPEPGNGVGDPVAVARAGVDRAIDAHHDVVIVDTAGRLGVDAEMMAQAAAIRDAVQPDETLFVLDAMIGQDAVTTAEAFASGVGFTGVVLTKLDGDARGGAALSVRQITGVPIMFASTGEKLGDFDVFHPDRMASRILGMGDVLSLIEQAEQVFEADQAEEMAAKLAGNDFTLEDFLQQMMMIRRMGPIGGLLGMLPGAGQMKDALAQVDDRDIDRTAAIIQSMTPEERRNPGILNASRRKRIANGSGSTVAQVNSLVERFGEARKMMTAMAGRFGLPGTRSTRKVAKGKGKKGRKPVGRGPTPPKVKGGLPAGFPGLGGPGMGAPGLPAGAPFSQGMPANFGLDQLPPGFDPSKLKLPKK